MSSRDPATFRFGAYHLNPAARELLLGDERVALAPKAFDALLWLIKHRERAVGRDELGAVVWDKADFAENQIDQLIRTLRRAVGDNGSSQDRIRTVPRFGYRWVGRLESVAAEDEAGIAAANSVEPQPAAPAARFPAISIRSARLVLGILVLLAAVTGAWWLQVRYEKSITQTTATTAEVPAADPENELRGATPAQLIAVLPLAMDTVDDSQWAWLRLGLMDLLAARLNDGGMPVVPSHNIVALLGAQGRSLPTADKVREATGAHIVIAPSIERSGEGWRLQLELNGMEGSARKLEIHAADPTRAASEAADRVLVTLGKSPVPGHLELGDSGEEALVQHMQAAIAGNRFDMAQQLLDEAPQALRQAPRVRLLEGELLFQGGDLARALARFDALADAPDDGSIGAETRITALSNAASALTINRRFAEAMPRFDAAAALAKASQSPKLYGVVMQSRGVLHAMQGQFEAADSDFSQGRIALEIVGDTLCLAELDVNEAGTLMTRQRFVAAEVLQTHAIERLKHFPPGDFLATAYGNKIAMDLLLLDVPRALATAAEAQGMMEQSPVPLPPNPELDRQITSARLAAGRLAESRVALHTQLAALDPSESPELYSNTLIMQAKLAMDEGRPADAAGLARQAEDLYELPDLAQPHYAPSRADAARTRIRALQIQGQPLTARTALAQFTRWAEGRSDPVIVALLALTQAEQSAIEETAEAANIRFDVAMEAASPLAPAYLVAVVWSYGRHLLATGQLDQAARIIGRVARWSDRDFRSALLQVQLYHALGQPDAWRRALATARSLAGERTIPPALSVAPLDADEQFQRAHGGSPIF